MIENNILFKDAVKDYLVNLVGDPQYELTFQRHLETEHFNTYIDYVEKYKNLKDLSILDLGCGSGGCTYQLIKRGAKVTSIEIDRELLKLSMGRNRQNSHVDFLLADGTRLPFKNESFDVCICLHVIEHVNDTFDLIKDLNRILKYNGILLLEYPNRFYPMEQHSGLKLINYLPKRFANFIAKKISTSNIVSKNYRSRFNIILLYPHNLSYFSVKKHLKLFPLKILEENPLDRFILESSLIRPFGAGIKFIFEKIDKRTLKTIARVFSRCSTFILQKEIADLKEY